MSDENGSSDHPEIKAPNIETSAQSPVVKVGGPWKPGQSGNPAGRPKSLMDLIKTQTKNGNVLIDVAMAILTQETYRNQTVKIADRLEALKWLADRGWGKAIQPVEHSGEVAIHELVAQAHEAAVERMKLIA